jgi:phosphatidate cytidylyltransferase
MNNFTSRTSSGIVFVVLIVGSILLSPFVFMGLMFFINLAGVIETNRLTLSPSAHVKRLHYNLFTNSLIFILLALAGTGLLPQVWLLAGFLLVYVPLVVGLYQANHTTHNLHTAYWISLLYVTIPSGLLMYFFSQNNLGDIAGPYLLLLMLVLIWANDVFAYLTGIWLGKNRLFERISPKKSWEGAAGGLIMTLFVAWLVYYFSAFMPLWRLAGMAIVVVVSAIYGDLIESMLKRQAGVKDSGVLIPGHGGILDRFDATFFATPFVFVYLLFTSGL